MKNKQLTVFVVFTTMIMSGLVLYLFISGKESSDAKGEVVFIDNFRVFEEFEMKKEYDQLLEKEISGERLMLDSLGKVLNEMISSKTLGENEVNKRKTAYLQNKETLEAKMQELSHQYTNKVYERLNLYIKDFGKANHYRFILGSGGEGNIMYVDKQADITPELIRFINKKYLDN